MASQRSFHHLIHTRLDGAKHTRNYLRNPGCRKALLRTICLWDPLTAHKLGHLQSNRSQPSTWWKLSLLYTIGGDSCRPKWPCLVPAGSPGGERCIQRVGESGGGSVYCQNFSLLPLGFSWEVTGSSSGKNSGDGTPVFWYCHHHVPLDYSPSE